MPSLKLSIAALVGLAAELHAAGAIRPEHDQKFSMLRTGLDQANEQASETAPAPAPGVPEFQALAAQLTELSHTVETLALTVDHTGGQVQSLVDLANTPKG